MRFLAPGFLHLLWLLVIPVALYLYKRQARRVTVSTLLFFRLLAREHQEAAWLRQLKRWLSLLLSLLIFLALMLALARPIWTGVEEGGALVVVVDRSASMAAVDGGGVSRLEEGRRQVRKLLAGVPETVPVSLVAADARAEVLLARSTNRRECLRILEAMETVPVEDSREAAWRVARRMQSLVAGSQVWWVTDTTGGGGTGEEMAAVKWLDVALTEAVNVGITAFQVRALPLERERLEGFLQVSAAAGNPGQVATRLEVKVGGRLAQVRELELEAGGQRALSLPLEGVRGQVVEVRLSTPGDCLPWDDGVVARLPAGRPLRVGWYAEAADPFTELAFQSLVDAGRVEMWRGDTAAFPPKDKPDVYVFENWLPKLWPEDRPVIALRPPRSAGPLTVRTLPGAGLPHPAVRVTKPEHPVLYRVSADRVALTQSCVLELGAGLEALWKAGDEVLLAAGEAMGQRVVAGAFTPARSEQLALLPAFPLVLGNALFWCAEDATLKHGLRVTRTGETLELHGRVEWNWWDGRAFQSGAEAADGWLVADRVGAWTDADGQTGMTLLASVTETDVPLRAAGVSASGVEQVGSRAVVKVTAGPGWTVVRWLLVALLGVLLLESYLFHRQAVY